MSYDPMKVCGNCSAEIRSEVEGVWIWEHVIIPRQMLDEWREVGPFHIPCADELLDDDLRYQRTEPDQEPSERDLQDMMSPDNGPSDAHYRAAMIDAGRGHLLR